MRIEGDSQNWSSGGHVDGAKGTGSVDTSGFVVTPDELLVLVKHWATVSLDVDCFAVTHRQVGDWHFSRQDFADERIDEIVALIGDEAVQKAVNEVRKDFERSVRSRSWRIFRHGTETERAAFFDELQALLDRRDAQATRGTQTPPLF